MNHVPRNYERDRILMSIYSGWYWKCQDTDATLGVSQEGFDQGFQKLLSEVIDTRNKMHLVCCSTWRPDAIMNATGCGLFVCNTCEEQLQWIILSYKKQRHIILELYLGLVLCRMREFEDGYRQCKFVMQDRNRKNTWVFKMRMILREYLNRFWVFWKNNENKNK